MMNDGHGSNVTIAWFRSSISVIASPSTSWRLCCASFTRDRVGISTNLSEGARKPTGHFCREIEPEIRALRLAIVEAVETYRKQLPAMDPTHPMLGLRRDGRVRFSGSWSVRLSGHGRHSQHVHPQGWISSALYVAVPDGLSGEEGWLSLGDPQVELGQSIAPIRRIAPKPGQLVLFPSMMWHGTLPFAEGERLTVAFDVAPPR